MKTSKITKVVEVKPWNGANGTVYYQSLEMENGDKINIGKKKELQVGWELTYEITDTSQEYNKAKAVNPQYNGGGQPQQPKTGYAALPEEERILWSVCIKEATAIQAATGRISSRLENIDPNANEIDLWADSITALTNAIFIKTKEYLNG